MRKIIFKNFQSPGDIVMMTVMVRDLHRCYPGQFITDVRTSCSALWENNPYLTPLQENNPEVKVIQCEYPLIHKSNQGPWHFIHGFIQDVNQKLDLDIHPMEFKGDIHISDLERSWISQVQEITGEPTRFWVICAGGKYDFTAKWWDPAKWQAVVDYFAGRLQFVQVGEAKHHHPVLKGVINLVGKTDLRQFVRLIYHADGVCCHVSFPMHLAAALPGPHSPNKPCVVVAGGREPSQWEAYPHHQYIHTNGCLSCCDNGGCWKSRIVPLGDGDEKDKPENLCLKPVHKEGHPPQPKCLDMITSEDVIRRIEMYLDMEKKNES